MICAARASERQGCTGSLFLTKLAGDPQRTIVIVPVVKIRRVRPGVPFPRYQTEHAAGLDLAANLDAALTLGPGQRAAVPTGIAVEIPPGFEGQVRARSGRALRDGLALVNSPGTVDADYRGE